MPSYVVSRLQDLLNDQAKPLKGSRVVLLGLAYKGDIEDLRESPALKVWEQLEKKGAQVVPVDPYCSTVRWRGEECPTQELTAELLDSCDAVLVTTAHLHRVDYRLVLDRAPLVLDAKNVLAQVLGKEAASPRVFRL